MKKSIWMAGAIGGVSMLAGVAATMLAFHSLGIAPAGEPAVAAGGAPTVSTPLDVADVVTAGQSGVNSAGESYGPFTMDANKTAELVEAFATNGKLGYISADAHFEALLATGKPASSDSASQIVTIPVTLSDGVTVIGEYEVVVGTGESKVGR